MRSLLIFALSLSLSGTALGEGPGSQLRATPEIPQATPMPTNPVRPERKHCETLPTEQRQQCLADLRAPTPRPHGPASIGGSAGAATGTSSGTTGGATFGGSAPR